MQNTNIADNLMMQVLFENYLAPIMPGEQVTEAQRRNAILALVEDLALGRMEPENMGVSQNELADELVRFTDYLFTGKTD